MSLNARIPELDDINFDALVENGRGLIPRYAPDWTDHNLHDPGITLIDLLAHLTDQQIYRIGHVGPSLRAAFTRLLGITPRGPESARILIWPVPGAPLLDIEKDADITSPDLLEANFTADADTLMVPAEIATLLSVTGAQTKELGPGLAEGRDPLLLWPFAGGGPRALEISLTDELAPVAGAGTVALGVSLIDPPSHEGVAWDDVRLEQWDTGGYWRPIWSEDGTKGLRRSGVIRFQPNGAATADGARFRLRLDQGFRPASVTIDRIALNVIAATEGRDIEVERLGEGTGLPDQLFEMETDSIVALDDLMVRAAVDGEDAEWQIVEELTTSSPGALDVALEPDGLRFGNGLNGREAPAGAQIRIGPLRRSQGAQGAVTKGLYWRVAGQVIGTNIAPSTAGRDRDGFAELAARARGAARTRDAMLRADARIAALRDAGLGLSAVQVMPRRRPGLEGKDAPGHCTVLVVPERDPKTKPPPPSRPVRDAVAAMLSQGRLMGERLHVSLPLYRDIDLSLTLLITADANSAEVRREAKARLMQRLWDIPRSADQEIEAWPAGRPVTVGEIAGLMTDVADVMAVPSCKIGDGGTLGIEPITLADREFALLRDVAIELERFVEGQEV